MPLQFLSVLQPQTPGRMSDGRIIFKNEAKNVRVHFPELNYHENVEGSPAVFGDLVLNDGTGAFIDKYSIRIIYSKGYPYSFPLVFETDERLPINIDWHVFPDGHCCIKAIPEEILLCKKGIALDWFIREQVIPYFFNQKHRELYGYFLHERSHGVPGTIQYFKEHFNTQNNDLVLKLLLESQKISEQKSNSKCLCGSGRKFKKCHRRSLRTTKVFSHEEINYFINLIRFFVGAKERQ
jgi:hypothetical protein